MSRRLEAPSSSDSTLTAPPDAHYSLFVVRWRRRLESENIEVEHVQSGDRTRVSSPARAVKWMSQHMGGDSDPSDPSHPIDPNNLPAPA